MSSGARATRLIIDASVAGSAGETKHPVSSLCRSFLGCMLVSTCHLVMSDDISGEWNRHQSRYARQWRKAMTARRRVVLLRDVRLVSLRSLMVTAKMLKDVHLLEAALATDKRIVSNDNEARNAYRRIAHVRLVLWINPSREDETAIEWLNAGAKLQRNRQLGRL
jgi:hypothetical protein